MNKKVIFVACLGIGLLITATALATGRVSDSAREKAEATAEAASAASLVAGQGSGGCKTGFDTQTATNTPPDDSTADNVPAATVTLTKARCSTFVAGVFTSETSTPNAGDFLHIDMRATCIGTGGFSTHCPIGKQVFASPGHTFLQNAQSAIQTHAMQMVWTGLGAGQWRFEVLPGGNASANLQFRSFVVSAF